MLLLASYVDGASRGSANGTFHREPVGQFFHTPIQAQTQFLAAKRLEGNVLRAGRRTLGDPRQSGATQGPQQGSRGPMEARTAGWPMASTRPRRRSARRGTRIAALCRSVTIRKPRTLKLGLAGSGTNDILLACLWGGRITAEVRPLSFACPSTRRRFDHAASGPFLRFDNRRRRNLQG